MVCDTVEGCETIRVHHGPSNRNRQAADGGQGTDCSATRDAAGGSTADQEDAGTNYSSINCGAGETSPHKDAKAIGPLQPIDELSVTGSVRRRV